MDLRIGLLVALAACGGGATPAPRSAPASSPEVERFEAQLAGCHEDGEQAANDCQEALLAAALCENGRPGAICDHLRQTGALPPEPPPLDWLFGCWEVIEPWDGVASNPHRAMVSPPPPPPLRICFEASSVLRKTGGSWNRREAGYARSDTRDLAGYAVGGYQLFPLGDELSLMRPGTLTRARLRRIDLIPPNVPAVETVCEAARRCLEAWAALRAPAPEGDEEGPDLTVQLEADSARGCHCRLARAPDTVTWAFGATQWDEPPPTPPACDLEQLPYDASALGSCG